MKKGKDSNSNYNLRVDLNTYNKRKSGKLVSALSVCLALGLGACSEIPCIYLEGDCTSDNCVDNNCLVHTHSYTKLNHDETSHWYECPEDGEIDSTSISEHSYVNTIIDPYYDYDLDEAASGSSVYTCSVCGYSYSKDIENTNIYTKPSSDEEETSLLTQQNLDTIPTDGGTLVLTNGEYSELYLRVSNAVSTSDEDGNHTREVNGLTIKGDGETVVDGLVISDDYYDYDENNPQPASLNVKALEGDEGGDGNELDHALVINNLVIEDIDFTSSIRISGNVVINGLTIRNCTYTYPSEYRYLSGSDLVMSADTSATVDLSTVGLLYAVNSGDTPWTNIVIDGCSVIEPYYGIYIEGDASVSVTNCYLSSYRFVKYLTSSDATSTGNAAIGTYNELISIKPHDDGSISSDVSITNNTFQGGHYTKYSSIILSNGSILVDGIGEDGSFTFTGNTAGDTVNKNTVVATFSNITSSNISIEDNTYTSPTMGMNFSSTFDLTEEPSNIYQWKVMYADTLYTFDNGSDIEYFCNACWNNGTNLDHADHLNHEHGHTDSSAAASKDFDAEWDEATHAMILANYYSSPYMSFYLDFLDFSKHDYMISFDLDFSSFKAENGEYVSISTCIAHDYNAMDVEVGYDANKTVDGVGGFYVTAKAHNGTNWDTVTHHEEDGKVHIEMNFSKDYNIQSNAGGPAYFTMNVYEGDVYNKGTLVASVSSSHSSGAGTSCIQWCPDAGHSIDTDHDGQVDHNGYTEYGDYVEIDNFGFTVLENNVTRPIVN